MQTKEAKHLLCSLIVAILLGVVSAVVSVVVQRFDGASKTSGDAAFRAMVERPHPTLALDSIGGLDDVKATLRRSVVAPLSRPEVFYRGPTAVRPPSAILMCGPPGTGKTMCARATASEAQVPIVMLTAASLESKWYGETPKLLNGVFRYACKEVAPCILFFDEVDGMGRSRTDSDQSCVYSFKCELLRNMDEAAQCEVSLLACTNCPASLDPALRRRFQRTIHFATPTETERLAILEKLTAEEVQTDDGLLRWVAASTPNMTGADLRSAFVRASECRMDLVSDPSVTRVVDGHALLEKLGPLKRRHWEVALGIDVEGGEAEVGKGS